MPYFLLVAAGLAPPAPAVVAGVALGVTGLFSGQSEDLAFSALLIVPGLLGCGIAFFVGYLLARLTLRSAFRSFYWAATSAAFAPMLASLPIYISGGHNSSRTLNLWSLLGETIGQWPAWAWVYCVGLLIVHIMLIRRLRKIDIIS